MKKNIESTARRGFLKKSLYTAPSIIVLGSLTKPQNLQAGGSIIPDNPGGGRGNINSISTSGTGLAGNGLGP